MRKGITFRVALFAFVSAIICTIGNYFLDMEVLEAVIHGLGFLSYLFVAIFFSQLMYERIRYATNVIVLFMSFVMALYCILEFSVIPFEPLLEYYVLFFYCFVILCVVSAIVLVGRIIFSSPQKGHVEAPAIEVDKSWTCACGTTNKGKFCAECGAAQPVKTDVSVVEEIIDKEVTTDNSSEISGE